MSTLQRGRQLPRFNKMIRIPNKNKQFSQTNRSDNEGNIWSSFNLNLNENVGRIRVSPRGIMTTQTSKGVEDMETPVCFAFEGFSNAIWAIGGVMLKNGGKPSDAFNIDILSNSPVVGSGSSMELFNGQLYVIGENEIRRLTLGITWNEVGTDEGVDLPTATCVYGG